MDDADIARFWSKVDVRGPDECWPWTGRTNDQGYGLAYGYGQQLAHRVAWMLANGQAIPRGMYVCHSCDNPPCCNYNDLFLGTPRANSRDRDGKGRAGNLYGERHYRTRLTNAQAAEIIRRCSVGESRASVARAFDVSWATVAQIYAGTSFVRLDRDLVLRGIVLADHVDLREPLVEPAPERALHRSSGSTEAAQSPARCVASHPSHAEAGEDVG